MSLYVKRTDVLEARKAVVGESFIASDGIERIAESGDIIVTRPDGIKFLCHGETFMKEYRVADISKDGIGVKSSTIFQLRAVWNILHFIVDNVGARHQKTLRDILNSIAKFEANLAVEIMEDSEKEGGEDHGQK